MPDKSSDGRSAESLIRELRPIIVAFLGSSGVVLFTRADVPERLRVAAEILFWISLSALIASIIAAVYPVVGEPQVRWCWNRASDHLRRRAEHRHFDGWSAKWRDYTLLVEAAFSEVPPNWEGRQDEYQTLRDWLLAHQRWLASAAVLHVRRHLALEWTDLTKLEERLGKDTGIFPLVGHREFRDQLISMLVDSGGDSLGASRRRLSHTFASGWDGLSDYSIKRGWGPLAQLRAAAANIDDAREGADAMV